MPKKKDKEKAVQFVPVSDVVIGHDRAFHFLQTARKRNRLAHAYLLTGPEGIGKRSLAVRFSGELLDTPDPQSHPGFFFIAREGTKQNIAIRQMQDLRRTLALRPSDDGRRIVLIDEADTLSEEAMNAILKTLEEPPAATIFLLVTSRPAGILPTIHSRCHRIRMTPVPEEEMIPLLESLGWPAEEAALASRLTGGRPGIAIAHPDRIREARARLGETLELIRQRDTNAITERIVAVRSPSGKRVEAVLLFDLLILALRELLRARLENRPFDERIVPSDAGARFSSCTEEDLADRIDLLLQHRAFIERNANVGLAVENALLRL